MTEEFETAWAKRPWETESRTDKDRAWFWWQASRSAVHSVNALPELVSVLELAREHIAACDYDAESVALAEHIDSVLAAFQEAGEAMTYQHTCTDEECIYLWKPSASSCGCHKSSYDALIAELVSALGSAEGSISVDPDSPAADAVLAIIRAALQKARKP